MRPKETRKRAVVLFNLGGPDRPAAIGPFLLNLFRDPAILRMPAPVRAVLARLIASARLRAARENYALLDGRSPLLDLTRAQAAALEAALVDLNVRCFIAMRYWHPFCDAAARAVQAWGADEVVLLPLYPQYSTTTTDSSLVTWHDAAARAGLAVDTRALCCYANDAGYVTAITNLVRYAYLQAASVLPHGTRLRVLFSAHGLPQTIIARGDPYQWQIEQTVSAVLARWDAPDVDWVICYQSRATPQRWLEPSTIDEIHRAARDRVALLLVPIAFVSEHSETLVELDIEYRQLADKLGVPGYFRAPTPGTDSGFIAAMARLVRQMVQGQLGTGSSCGARVCPASYTGCPYRHAPGLIETSP